MHQAVESAFIDIGYFVSRFSSDPAAGPDPLAAYDNLLMLRMLFPNVTAFGMIGREIHALDEGGTRLMDVSAGEFSQLVERLGVRVHGGQRLYNRELREAHSKLKELRWHPRYDQWLVDCAADSATGRILDDQFYTDLDRELNAYCIAMVLDKREGESENALEKVGRRAAKQGEAIGMKELAKSDDDQMEAFREVLRDGRARFVEDASGWPEYARGLTLTPNLYRGWRLLQNVLGDRLQFSGQPTLHTMGAGVGGILSEVLGAQASYFDKTLVSRELDAVQVIARLLRRRCLDRRLKAADILEFDRAGYGARFRDWLHTTMSELPDGTSRDVEDFLADRLLKLEKSRDLSRELLAVLVAAAVGTGVLFNWRTWEYDFNFAKLQAAAVSAFQARRTASPLIQWMARSWNPGAMDTWHAWLCDR